MNPIEKSNIYTSLTTVLSTMIFFFFNVNYKYYVTPYRICFCLWIVLFVSLTTIFYDYLKRKQNIHRLACVHPLMRVYTSAATALAHSLRTGLDLSGRESDTIKEKIHRDRVAAVMHS